MNKPLRRPPPVGERWADKVKLALQCPDGELAKIKRRFDAFKVIVKAHPKRYRFRLTFSGGIGVNDLKLKADHDYERMNEGYWSITHIVDNDLQRRKPFRVT